MRRVGCGSAAVVERSERTSRGYRRLRRRACGEPFNERGARPAAESGAGPPGVAALVVLWRLRHRPAPRDLAEMPVARGIVFRHEAARDWEAEPSPVPSGEPRHCMGDAGGGRRHADEMCM